MKFELVFFEFPQFFLSFRFRFGSFRKGGFLPAFHEIKFTTNSFLKKILSTKFYLNFAEFSAQLITFWNRFNNFILNSDLELFKYVFFPFHFHFFSQVRLGLSYLYHSLLS